MTQMYLSDALVRLGACPESVEWVRARRGMPGGLRATWEACERGDWLIWLARRVIVDDRKLRLIACDCADWALLAECERGREPDPRSWESVRVSREYAEGLATRDTLLVAQDAAREARGAAAAAYAAYAAAGVAVAAAAANAAYAAVSAAAYAAVSGGYAAAANAAYAADAVYAAAYAAERKAQAGIVRRRVRLEDVLAGIEREAA